MIVYSNPQRAKNISRFVNEGKLFLITRGVYTNQAPTTPNYQKDIKENLLSILKHLKVAGIFSYQSAIECQSQDWSTNIWIVSARNRNIELGPYTINVLRGNEQELNTFGTTVLPDTDMRVPDMYRMALQNFSIRKVDSQRINKNLAFDSLIAALNEKRGKYSWEEYKGQLNIYSKELSLEDAEIPLLTKLNEYRKNNEFDNLDGVRVSLFNQFLGWLQTGGEVLGKTQDYVYGNKIADENVAFFEAYFSNYIEGTEFEVEEAQSIIFDPQYKYERHEDGHDIIKTYQLILNNIESPVEINTATQYIEQIKSWHMNLFSHRSASMGVGVFKTRKNRAGNTSFVVPELCEPMLRKSFEMSKLLDNPVARAYFLKTTFTEIHPFDDGNGRISRIILNNQLSCVNKQRIIIPTVFRDNYVGALKAFSQNRNVKIIVSALNQAQLISSSLPYDLNITPLINYLKNQSAFIEPGLGLWGVPPIPEIEEGGQLNLFSSSNLKKQKP